MATPDCEFVALEFETLADLLVKMPNSVRRGRRVGRQAHVMPRDCFTTVQGTAVVMEYLKSAKLARLKAQTRTIDATQTLWIDRSVCSVCDKRGVDAEIGVRKSSLHGAGEKNTRQCNLGSEVQIQSPDHYHW